MVVAQGMAGDLAARLAEEPMPIYAVIDGAKFSDLPTRLATIGVAPSSLFLDQRDSSVVQAGPFLARLDAHRLMALFRIDGIEAATVFWSAPTDQTVFYQHLRRLNLADIPLSPERGAGSVLFRHWDPAVMALVLPTLEPAQRAQLFGPAVAMVMASPEGVLVTRRRDDWPEPARGRLRFSATQMAMIADTMAARSRRAIAAYLRETAPDKTASLDQMALLDVVRRSETVGRELGLTTERAFGQFAYLMLISDGRIADSIPARTYLAGSADSPDLAVGRLLLAMAYTLDPMPVQCP
jgi:hypothetical protein